MSSTVIGTTVEPVRVTGRLLAVDALRGVAAMAVVLFHVPESLRSAVGMPGPIDAVFARGYLGVDAFFVLSGFVIAMSVASGPWTFGYLLRFVARRSVRLDPSYWAAIALELCLAYIGVRFLRDAYAFPSPLDVLAHVAYLQGVLNVAQISDVFWTLCYEIQFYLLLVGSLVLSHATFVRRFVPAERLLAAVFAVLLIVSLAVRGGVLASPNDGLALGRIYQFALGVSAYLFATRRISVLTLSVIAGVVTVARVWDKAFVETAVILIAFATCLFSLRSRRLNQLLDVRPVQFLGRISYSLYLYHASIVGRAAAVTLLLGKSVTIPHLPLIGLVASVAGSVLFAYVMFRLIEAPTLRLSRKIRLGHRSGNKRLVGT